ncbi:MAG TPA: 1-acyl-sn-glycerol-3-phosphate acyltransferase [Candidatus Thermoplasmatota archaeon]|nr:1-acyl-sn-glycerol-3-phosphate acyltransferase [Candidatus Thermoplasmatota archaeon]
MVPDLGVDGDFVEGLAPAFRRLRKYCRLEVEGIDRIPPGPCVLVSNHTGWLGLDYGLLCLVLWDDARRIPRGAVHPTFFRLAGTRAWAEKLGLFEASVGRSLAILDDRETAAHATGGRKGGVVCFFPEGEEGNFKPISERYRLQEFKPGFARVALAAKVPVVPVVIVGGEDANPSLARIDATRDTLGLSLPVPLNLFPFPVKWRIAFMDPIDPHDVLARADVDEDVPLRLARELQITMQAEVDRQLAIRGHPVF